MIQASDGNFYGTTPYGGSANFGTDFQDYAHGHIYRLWSTSPAPTAPTRIAALIQASDGNLYGTTTRGGGANGPVPTQYGTVFKVTTGWNLDDALCLYLRQHGRHGAPMASAPKPRWSKARTATCTARHAQRWNRTAAKPTMALARSSKCRRRNTADVGHRAWERRAAISASTADRGHGW